MSREKLGRCLALVYRPDRQKRSKVRYPVSVYKQFRILSSREKLCEVPGNGLHAYLAEAIQNEVPCEFELTIMPLSSREKPVRYPAMVCMPTWLKPYKVR